MIFFSHATTKSENWLIAATLMPLFIACSTPKKGYIWLQSHYKEIQPFFHQYMDMHTVTYNFNADEHHIQLVKNKIRTFNDLMTKLENKQIIIKKETPRKRKLRSIRNRHSRSSNNEFSKSKAQDQNVLYTSPIGTNNFEDLTACLATCSKKLCHKVEKPLKINNTLCSDDNAKLNTLFSRYSNAHVPKHTTSVPDLKDSFSESSDKYCTKTDLETIHNAEAKKWVFTEQRDTYKNKSQEQNEEAVEKNKPVDEIERRLDLKKTENNTSDTSEQTPNETNKIPETVDKFVLSEKREFQNPTDSGKNGEYELESQNAISDFSESKCSKISIQNEFSETKLAEHTFKSYDDDLCMKISRNSTSALFSNWNSLVNKEDNNELKERTREDKVDYNTISEDKFIKSNTKEKSNISQNNNLIYSTLQILYQEFVAKYTELCKVQREKDYPGHKCIYNENRYLCQIKDETLKKLKIILPKIEEEYLQRLSLAWKFLTPHLKNVKNEQNFYSVARRLKQLLLNLISEVEKKLKELRASSSVCFANISQMSYNVSNPLSNLGSISNRNNIQVEFSKQPDKQVDDFSDIGYDHLLQSTVNILDEDNEDVITESIKTKGCDSLYEKNNIFSNSAILDNTTICQKYDQSYANMSLKDCIIAQVNQLNTTQESTKTNYNKEYSLQINTEEEEKPSKNNTSKSSKKLNISQDITENFIKHLDQYKGGKNNAFSTISCTIRDPIYFYNKNLKLKEVSFFKNQSSSTSTNTSIHPALQYPSEKKQILKKITQLDDIYNIWSPTCDFSQAGFDSLCKSRKKEQINDVELMGQLQLSLPSQLTDALTVRASNRYVLIIIVSQSNPTHYALFILGDYFQKCLVFTLSQ